MMTSFARIEEERLFLERCDRLQRRLQNIKARVDNSTPSCMYGSFLGKRNEMRKSLTSAGSARTQSSGESEIEIPEDATIEQKIEHFLIQINYKNPPQIRGKRFPYLKQPPRIEPIPQAATDLMDIHSVAFTQSYPRILRYDRVGSKLRQMPLLYQKVSISSSEEVQSDGSPSTDSASDSATSRSSGSSSTAPVEKESGKSTSSSSSERSIDGYSSGQDSGKNSEKVSTVSSNGSKAVASNSRRTASTVSTVSSQKNEPAPPLSSKSDSEPTSMRERKSSQKPTPDGVASGRAASSGNLPDQDDAGGHRAQSPAEVSNADTTHGIPPMESTANSPIHEDGNHFINFLNDVTDVILGMNMFSASAIDAAIDAILATNLYGDLDKERARQLLDQMLA